MTLEDSAHDGRTVGLDAWGRTLGSALSTEDILFEILFREFQASRNTVQYHTDEFPVGLTENAYSEFSAECIHIVGLYLFILLFPQYITLFKVVHKVREYDIGGT